MAGAYSTLVLDHHGRIVSCGDAAAQMLGERSSRLRGRNVADFVHGLSLGGTSARYRSGYLDYLATQSTWRELVVSDAEGGNHVASFKLSPIADEGQRLFLLAMRKLDTDQPLSAVPSREAVES